MNMNTMSSANRHNSETWQQHHSPCIHIRFWWTFKLPTIVDQTFQLNKNILTIYVSLNKISKIQVWYWRFYCLSNDQILNMHEIFLVQT
jgi:hypothetical protein